MVLLMSPLVYRDLTIVSVQQSNHKRRRKDHPVKSFSAVSFPVQILHGLSRNACLSVTLVSAGKSRLARSSECVTPR